MYNQICLINRGNMMARSVFMCLVLLVTSCAKPFQPVAPSYKFWSQPGKTELDVKKTMLECGFPTPDPRVVDYEYAFGLIDEGEVLNAGFMNDACMENAGYTPREYTVSEYCGWDWHIHLPVCQPGAVIPRPSMERRLNSRYCNLKTDYEYCLEHGKYPPACKNNNYDNPPLECLP